MGSSRALFSRYAAVGGKPSLGKMHMAQEERAIIGVMHLASECEG